MGLKSTSLPNLAAALRRLSVEEAEKRLWIDAICINQADAVEKTHQVQMMREIYSLASQVIVWLGPEEPSDDEALAQLSRLREWGHGAIHLPYFYAMMAPSWLSRVPITDEFVKAQLVTSDSTHPVWDGIDAIFRRRWFYRMWIIQEFLSAKQRVFWLGPKTLEWELDFGSAPLALDLTARMRTLQGPRASAIHVNAFHNAEELTTLRYDHEGDGVGSLYEVLSKTYGFDSTDPRDRVFAIIGLVQGDSEKAANLVDYSKSTQQVLIEVAKQILLQPSTESGPGLSMLSHVIDSESRPHSLPSWVPEWVLKEERYQPLCAAFKAVPEKTRDFWIDNDNALHLQALVFDRVRDLSPPPQDRGQGNTRAADILNWVLEHRSVTSLKLKMYPKSSTLDVWKHTLVCDSADNGSGKFSRASQHELDEYDKWLTQLRRFSYPYGRTIQIILDSRIGQLGSQYGFRVAEWTYRRLYSRVKHAPGFVTAMAWALLYPTLVAAYLCIHVYRSLQRLSGDRLDSMLGLLIRPLRYILGKLSNIYTERSGEMISLAFNSYGKAFDTWSSGRNLLITEKGRIGWVQKSARLGDKIAMFGRCTIPFTLRERDDGTYQLIGDTYLYGTMGGEVFDDESAKEQDIVVA